jgi:hypothetical protein
MLSGNNSAEGDDTTNFWSKKETTSFCAVLIDGCCEVGKSKLSLARKTSLQQVLGDCTFRRQSAFRRTVYF